MLVSFARLYRDERPREQKKNRERKNKRACRVLAGKPRKNKISEDLGVGGGR